MTFVEKRNALVLALAEYVGRPVLLANQVQPEEAPPYIVWAVLSDYTPDGSLGHYSMEDAGEGYALSVRSEQPTATLSFTACSINRKETGKDGEPFYVLGADEAQELAGKAQGFFLHGGRYSIQKAGFVVVEVTNATPRDALELDEMGRRFGFDVRLRYVRTDAEKVTTIDGAVTKQTKKEEKTHAE